MRNTKYTLEATPTSRAEMSNSLIIQPCSSGQREFFAPDTVSEHSSHVLAAVRSLSCVWLFATLRTVARQASLSFTVSQSLLKLVSIELVMPTNHLVLCHPLLLWAAILPRGRPMFFWFYLTRMLPLLHTSSNPILFPRISWGPTQPSLKLFLKISAYVSWHQTPLIWTLYSIYLQFIFHNYWSIPYSLVLFHISTFSLSHVTVAGSRDHISRWCPFPSHPTKVIPTDSFEKLLERKHITRLTSYVAPSGSCLFPTGIRLQGFPLLVTGPRQLTATTTWILITLREKVFPIIRLLQTQGIQENCWKDAGSIYAQLNTWLWS